jgi:membrane protein DedA with SNARE-associated domain
VPRLYLFKKRQRPKMLIIELIILFLTAFGLNLIPFAGPSNLLIASTAAVGINSSDPITLFSIGLTIAIAAALAKGIYYGITFFVSKHLSEKRQARLDAEALKVKRWAFLLLFLAAATPIPDEPIVIPLGLLKYNLAKFFTAFFLGKLSITVAGAFFGNIVAGYFSNWLSPTAMVIISIVLTVIITIFLLKVDFGKLAERFFKKKPTATKQEKL